MAKRFYDGDKKQVTVYLSKSDELIISAISDSTGLSMSSVISVALEQSIEHPEDLEHAIKSVECRAHKSRKRERKDPNRSPDGSGDIDGHHSAEEIAAIRLDRFKCYRSSHLIEIDTGRSPAEERLQSTAVGEDYLSKVIELGKEFFSRKGKR